MLMAYYRRLWACPYYRSDERGAVICEGGRVELARKETMSEYMGQYCCDVDGWRRCTIARALNLQYERD